MPAITPKWMPSLVVPPWMSPMSLSNATEESLPRALRVDRGQDAGVRDEAQRGSVRGAPVVVVDRPAGDVVGVLVTGTRWNSPRSVSAEKRKKSITVSACLAILIAVGIVALRPQDPVKALDVVVLGEVGSRPSRGLADRRSPRTG